MITLPSLFPHQEELVNKSRRVIGDVRNIILQSPPGGGKTRMAKWMLGSAINKPRRKDSSGKYLFAVQMRGLVQNACDSFMEEPELPHGVIMSGVDTDYAKPLQVASIDTLIRRLLKVEVDKDDRGLIVDTDKPCKQCEGTAFVFTLDGDQCRDCGAMFGKVKGTYSKVRKHVTRYDSDYTFDFLIYDETHAHFPKFANFLEHHNTKRESLGLHVPYVEGLSGTPDAKGLSDVYQEIVTGKPPEWLIEHGYMSPFRYYKATQGNSGVLVKSGNDYTTDSVCEAMKGMAGDLVRDWKKYAEGRATIGFFPRRSQAKDAQRLLVEAGVRAEYVDGDTDDSERQSMFNSLDNGYIDYICNVEVIGRGTDIPRVSCVQLCLFIGSKVGFLQKVGRGSRVHPDAEDCIVIDHGQNVGAKHGFFEDDHAWVLDRSNKADEEPAPRASISCPSCDRIYRGGKCTCGYEPTPKERTAQGLEFDGSELVEIKPKDASTKPKKTKTADELMVKALYKAGKSGKTWKQACGIYYELCEEHNGRKMFVPKRFTVAGNVYNSVQRGDPQGSRRVSAIYEDLFD